MKNTIIPLLLFLCSSSCVPRQDKGVEHDNSVITYQSPRHFICYQAPSAIRIDGIISNDEWGEIMWSDHFVDIEGEIRPTPAFSTRVKLCWDNNYLYIAAQIEEPHVWANLTKRDTVVFYDNDFEVFIDPDGDTYNYYEIEVNALATVWDLLLTKPYRDGGFPVDSWDVSGLKLGVNIQGSLNDPTDRDEGWTIEMAIPFEVLSECTAKGMPSDQDLWRINFSRVEWHVDFNDLAYSKQIDPVTKSIYPENNWVWSPQGLINMHMPEHWGYLQFSTQTAGIGAVEKITDPNAELKWILREVYYAQRLFMEKHKRFANSLKDLSEELRIKDHKELDNLSLEINPKGYTASLKSLSGKELVVIDEGGLILELLNHADK